MKRVKEGMVSMRYEEKKQTKESGSPWKMRRIKNESLSSTQKEDTKKDELRPEIRERSRETRRIRLVRTSNN